MKYSIVLSHLCQFLYMDEIIQHPILIVFILPLNIYMDVLHVVLLPTMYIKTIPTNCYCI